MRFFSITLHFTALSEMLGSCFTQLHVSNYVLQLHFFPKRHDTVTQV